MLVDSSRAARAVRPSFRRGARELPSVLRAAAFVVALVVALLGVSVAQTSTQAHAFWGVPAMPITAPTSLVAGLISGTPSATAGTTVIGVTTPSAGALFTAVAAPLAVAGAGLAIGYGIGSALRWAWANANGDPVEAFVPPPPPAGMPPNTVPLDSFVWTNASLEPGQLGKPGPCLTSDNPNIFSVGSMFCAGVRDHATLIARRTTASGAVDVNSNNSWRLDAYGRFGDGSAGTCYTGMALNTVVVTQASTSSSPAYGYQEAVLPLGGCVLDPAFSGSSWSGRITYGSGSVFGAQGPGAGTSTGGETGVTGTPRQTTPRSQCADGSTVSGPAVKYSTGTPSKDLPPLVPPACPQGVPRIGVDFPTTEDGKTVTPPVPAMQPVIPDAFASCNPATGGKVCELTLVRIAPDARELVCNFSGLCVKWQTQTQPIGKTTTRTRLKPGPAGEAVGTTHVAPRPRYTNGDELECRWGSFVLDEAECHVVPTDPAADPPERTDDSGCNLSDFSLNPVSWVVVPLKCLFIPRDSAVQGAATALSNAWSPTAPAVVWNSVHQVAQPVVALKDDRGQQSCEGPTFTIPKLPTMDGPMTLHPMSTCNRLTAYMLGIWMPLSTALVYLGGFFSGTRLLLKTVNVDSPVTS